MSSSRVFKQDPHFTPTPLVQRNIAPPIKEANVAPAGQFNSPPPVQPPPSEPIPIEQPTAPAIDLAALREEAYNQGKADLAAQYHAEFQQTIKAFAEACQKVDSYHQKLLNRGQGDIINLIIALLKKVVGQELAMSRSTIATTLQTALNQAIESEEYHVTLHPDDLAFAEEKAPELIASIRGLERIIFKTDNTMTKGGCLLESAVCSIDASIDTQLQSVKEFLEEQPVLFPEPDIDEMPPSFSPPVGKTTDS